MAGPDDELSLGEHVCLALVAQGSTHGWQVGTVLAADGEVGRIWSLSRPLTYRAIDLLVDKALVSRTAAASGKGRERQLLEVTAAGQQVLTQWLDAPIEHLRDVRTELLLKLVIRERGGVPVEPLLIAQQRHFDHRIAALTDGGEPDDLVDLWRRESARSVRRFLEAALNPPVTDVAARQPIRISARNQLVATVAAIRHGEVMSTVKATLPDGQSITAAITKDSVVDLDLAHGDEIIVLVKSTEVMIAKRGVAMSSAGLTDGQPKVTFVGHATVLVEVGGLRILTDPLLTNRVAFIRRVAPPVPAATSRQLDMVLISHLHHDHLHVPSLRQIAPGTPAVVPRGATSAVRRGRFDDIVEVVAGDQIRIGDVTVTAVPALHSNQRLPIGRRAEPVGYLIESGNWSCYFAGDTDIFDDMHGLGGRVDVALLPVWGWGPTAGHGHLDPHRAADAIDIIKPRSVIPIHWGTLWPIGLSRFRSDRLVDPPHEMVHSLARFELETDVHLLAPGEAIAIAPAR